MKQCKTIDEFLAEMPFRDDPALKKWNPTKYQENLENDRSVTAKAAREPGVAFLVLFRNDLLDSSNAGACTVLKVGPGMTYHDLSDIEGQHLGDVPSHMKWPVAFIASEDCE